MSITGYRIDPDLDLAIDMLLDKSPQPTPGASTTELVEGMLLDFQLSQMLEPPTIEEQVDAMLASVALNPGV